MKIKFESIAFYKFTVAVVITMLCATTLGFCLRLFIDKWGILSHIASPGSPLDNSITSLIIIFLIGIPTFIAMALILKVSAREYIVEINSDGIGIKSKNIDAVIPYSEVVDVVIYNNTDYAKMIITTPDRKYRYYIGFANLLTLFYRKEFGKKENPFKIFDSFTELDTLFAKVHFEKKSRNKKGIDIVQYMSPRFRLNHQFGR